MCTALRLRGHHCIHAGTLADALVATVAFRPGVVLLEWSVRGGWGLGLARRLRSLADERLVVIAVSTQSEPDGFRAAEGVDEYFAKPISMTALDRFLVRAAPSSAE